MNREPRIHHYQFAHRVLPSIARQDSVRFFAEFCGSEARNYLYDWWDRFGEQLPEEDRIAPDGLNYCFRKHEDLGIVLVTLPTPISITEAYFTAFVFSLSSIDASTQTIPFRYFTLEYGVSLDPGVKRTVLGEWRTEGAHMNFGTGPDPDLEAFFNRVCMMEV